MDFGINGPIKEVDESCETPAASNVFERLVIDAQQIPDKKKGREMAQLERMRYDEQTGQELFKPKTGKGVRDRS